MGAIASPKCMEINSFHALTPETLLSIMHGWNDELNDEVDSELDILYAYLG